MRRIIWLALCAVAFGQGITLAPKTTVSAGATVTPGVAASGTPAYVQMKGCSTATSSCNVTLGAAVTAGDYIVAWEGGTGNSTGISVTMTGETITRNASCSNNTGAEGDCFVSTNAVGGQTGATCTFSGAANNTCWVAEFTSPLAGHAVDGTPGNAQSTTTAYSVATGATPPAVANDICVGMAYSTSSSGTLTPSGGWTQPADSPITNGSTGTSYMEYQVFAGTGTHTATGTFSANANAPEGIFCLKP